MKLVKTWTVVCLVLGFFAQSVAAHSIVEVVGKVKPSVVGVGVFDPLGSPRAELHGTGFVIGDGTLIATNYHVVDKEMDSESRRKRVIFVGVGNKPKTIEAEVIASDPVHDLALLRISEALAPLTLSDNTVAPDGTEIAFTGFPIGADLGIFPATHKGIVATYTPVAIPTRKTDQLTVETIRRLREPYYIYQLDAIAYPANSGSPVYELETGKVIGIVNSGKVKKTKEAAISSPTGITFAIPVQYLTELMESAKNEQ